MANKTKSKKKKLLQFAVKLILTAVALYFVFTKIDTKDLWQNFKSANPLWFVGAWLAFNLSKSLASLRQNRFYRACGTQLSDYENWRLYYLGMFYNIFLPGSISGDGYKVWLLNQKSNSTWQSLTKATLLDRVSGLALLLFLTSFIVYLSTLELPPDYAHWMYLPAAVAVLVLPGFYLGLRLFFPAFTVAYLPTTFLSLLVQLGQLLTAFCLLKALHVPGFFWDYLSLFMLSSVAAVIPITISGVGLREVVFLWGYTYLSIDKDKAIAFTLLFFGVTALSSLIGLVISYNLNLEDKRIGKEQEPSV